MNDPILVVAVVAGQIVGAGLGTYWGLKRALNGLKDSSIRIELAVGEVNRLVTAHRLDTARGHDS